MTKHEIIEAGLRGIGKVRTQGDTTEPAAPFLLADIMYDCYNKTVASLHLTREMKQMDTRWRRAYGLFNRPFFSAIPAAFQCDVTDMMDDLGKYLETEITILRGKIIRQFEGIDFEQAKIASGFLLTHIFAQYAQSAWGNTYLCPKRRSIGTIYDKEINPYLSILRDIAFNMGMTYIRSLPGDGTVEINEIDSTDIFQTIARKIYKWLKDN